LVHRKLTPAIVVYGYEAVATLAYVIRRNRFSETLAIQVAYRDD
jgi:hypothetical protein